jgi:hypothetical protein
VEVVADFVEDRAQRPRVDDAVVRKLDEGERVELAAEPAQWDLAAEGGWREASAATPNRVNDAW